MLIRVSIACICAASCAVTARAELSTLGVDIWRADDNSVRVSIESEVSAQQKKNITVDAAVKALGEIHPYDGGILVGIIVRGNVQTAEYLPIVKAIINAGQNIAFIDGEGPDYVRDNIRRRIISAR